jgi:large subunit ribosomal protein L21
VAVTAFLRKFMKYAIIKIGGSQIKVQENETFEIERQTSFEPEVLAYSDENGLVLGAPVLKDIKVVLEKLEDKDDKKVVIIRFKAKSRHKRKLGHRQPISVFKVTSIGSSTEVAKKPKASTKKEKEL